MVFPAFVEIGVAIGLIVWGSIASLWYLILLGSVLPVLPFVVWIARAIGGW